MALPSAPNAIGMNHVNTEFGVSASTTRDMNNSDLRLLFKGVNNSGTTISMSEGWGKGMYYEFRLYGASGGTNINTSGRPGDGGYTSWSGYIAVGTVVTYYVGQRGVPGTGQTRAGGSGGGGTAIIIGGSLIAMAGAGAGAGQLARTYGANTYYGGPGGGSSGIGGPAAPLAGFSGGGTQTAGGGVYPGRLNGQPGTGPATGTGKTGGDGQATNGQYPYAGGWGYGTGGRSGNSSSNNTDGAPSGGGGGYYGGGGGSDLSSPAGTGGGGGGGSGYVRTTSLPAGVTYISSSTTAAAGVNNGNAYIQVYRLGQLVTTLNYSGASATYTLP